MNDQKTKTVSHLMKEMLDEIKAKVDSDPVLKCRGPRDWEAADKFGWVMIEMQANVAQDTSVRVGVLGRSSDTDENRQELRANALILMLLSSLLKAHMELILNEKRATDMADLHVDRCFGMVEEGLIRNIAMVEKARGGTSIDAMLKWGADILKRHEMSDEERRMITLAMEDLKREKAEQASKSGN